MTKDEASLIYKVEKKTIGAWLRKAAQEDTDLTGPKQQDMTLKQTNDPDQDIQRQLMEAKLKIKALETMIDIAEGQFKIAIRKKPGAKQ
jgi:hypothetical protein